jgi:hypothetical protein
MATQYIAILPAASPDRKSSKAASVRVDSVTPFELKYRANGTEKTVVNLDGTQTLTNKTLTSPVLNSPTINSPAATYGVVSGTAIQTAGAATLTAAQSGSIVLFDKVDGLILTLPAPVVGLTYEFFIQSTISSNSAKVITNTGSVFLLGTVEMASENQTPSGTLGPKHFSADGSTHVAITQSGTTTGGVKGTFFQVTCITSTLWLVTGIIQASAGATIATPFATS